MESRHPDQSPHHGFWGQSNGWGVGQAVEVVADEGAVGDQVGSGDEGGEDHGAEAGGAGVIVKTGVERAGVGAGVGVEVEGAGDSAVKVGAEQGVAAAPEIVGAS